MAVVRPDLVVLAVWQTMRKKLECIWTLMTAWMPRHRATARMQPDARARKDAPFRRNQC